MTWEVFFKKKKLNSVCKTKKKAHDRLILLLVFFFIDGLNLKAIE